jgi:hypothetical protein
MTRVAQAAAIALAMIARGPGKPPAPHVAVKPPTPVVAPPARIWARPAPPLPMLPSVGRVRLEAARDRVIVLEDVNLPRGDWQSGGLDLYVAFGAPGTPTAIDARLIAVPTGSAEPRADDAGEAVSVESAIRRSPGAQPLLGRPLMAGVVVHVKEAQLRRDYALGGVAVLRIRSLLSAPAADPSGARDVVVRLGVAAGLPLTLGRIQLVSLEPHAGISRAEATLCGPDATAWPLSVSLVPQSLKTLEPLPSRPTLTIAPEMAVRHASDDLCVRWWASP